MTNNQPRDNTMTVTISVPIDAGEKCRVLTKMTDESWTRFRERVDRAIQTLEERANE
jgi:hypothetical protein